MSLGGGQVSIDKILHNSSHILGKHTVRILPETSAKLNPYNESFCIGGSKHNDISVPLIINSSLPVTFLTMDRTDLETGETHGIEYSKKTLSKLVESQVSINRELTSTVIRVPVSKTGEYRVRQILDKSNLEARLYRSSATVVNCPSAYFLEDANRRFCCVGEQSKVTVNAHGATPLRVHYGWYGNGQNIQSSLENLMNSREALESFDSQHLVYESVDALIDSKFETAGKYSYYLVDVVDRFGNRISYDQFERSRSSSRQNPTEYTITVEDRPSVSFQGCDIENPIKLLRGQQINIPLKLEPFPSDSYEVSFEYTDTESDDNFATHPDTFSLSVGKSRSYLTVSKSGLYSIASISGGHCSGDVRSPFNCPVVIPEEPSMTVSFQSIEDKCVGSVGIVAELDLIGSPPFTVGYRETTGGKSTSVKSVQINSSRQQLRFTPPNAGRFIYEFISLRDANYAPILLQGDEFRVEEEIFPKAQASFIDATEGKLEKRGVCLGTPVSLGVELSGSGPWTLKYEIVHGRSRDTVVLDDVRDSLSSIVLPASIPGGITLVQLVSIEDRNKCPSFLEGQQAVVEVRRDIPSVSFNPQDGIDTVEIPAGSKARLPLRFTGKGPWEMSYKHESSDKFKNLLFDEANSNLSVSEEGVYEIVSLRDKSCEGQAKDKIQMRVKFFPKPLLRLPGGQKLITQHQYSGALVPARQPLSALAELCEGSTSFFDLELSGQPPFKLEYQVDAVDDGGKIISTEQKSLSSNVKDVQIKIVHNKPGKYLYRMRSLSDKYYRHSGPDFEKQLGDQQLIVQEIRQRPRALFKFPRKVYRLCNQMVPACREHNIPVLFKGTPPFSIGLTILHELTGTEDVLRFSEIGSYQFNLSLPEHVVPVGTHQLKIRQVSDSKGCTQELPSEAPVSIRVSELPSVMDQDMRDEYCVGDRLSFFLIGEAPFKIQYEFNGHIQSSTIEGNIFSRVASKPGTFRLVSVSDASSEVPVSIQARTVKIHDLPSVRISEGVNVIEDIHEGDKAEIKFQFTGEPPFSFTYTRNEVKSHGPGKVLETHTVTDVRTFEYSIFSAVEGVFSVLSVSDNLCTSCPSCKNS